MKKRIFTLVAIGLLLMLAVTPAFAQTATACESTHTVAAGEWLSKIAETAYGSASEYFPIYSATNSQAIADTSFHFIDNPDQIEIGWKLCIPVKPVAPAGLSEHELKNATYKSDFGTDGVATLANGKYSAPAAPGSASMNTVFLGDEIAYGDVDGVPAAALVLVESGGGSGTFSTLHLVRSQDGKVNDVALGSLGDRINLTSLYIQDGKIVVGMTTQGPDEPMCCGTQRVLNTYALNGDKLDTASNQVVGKVEQEPTTPATGTFPAQELGGTSWKWTTSQFSDGKTDTPSDPNQYLLTFNADGTVGIKADCNQVGGTYTTEGNQLTITVGPSTLVACPEGSLGGEYVRQLGLVSSYSLKDGNLILEFKLDSGSMTFAPSATTGLAGTKWDIVNVNNGNQGVVSVVTGTTLTLAFGEGGRVSGNAGCNSFTGTYTSENNALNIGPLASTQKLCTEPAGVMEQEAQYLAALQKSATYSIAGSTLTIRDASDATQVVGNVAAAPAPLAGSRWDVVNYNNGKEAVVSVTIGTELTLNFGTDGRVSGSAGCNSFSGTYESSGDTIKIGPLASTRMLCSEPTGIMDQEAQYLTALQNSATYEIVNGVLTIRDTAGAMQVVANVAAAPAGLAGTAWDIISINNGNEAVVTLIPGTSATLNFGTDNQITGTGGCNSFGGPYESSDGTLKIGPLVSTMMFCDEPKGTSEQEQQYLAALQKAATYEISGNTLTIRDVEGAMQVVATVATAPTGLSGTSWQVAGVNNGNQAVVGIVAGTELTLDFSTEDQVSGNSGCNTFTGTYESGEGTVKIGQLASTLKLCTDPAGVNEQEQQYLAALQKAATYEIANNTLFLRDADGAQQVTATLK